MAKCRECGSVFEEAHEDMSFYERVSPRINGIHIPIPSPTLCPQCRWQRRLAFRNERTLHRRNCSLTGQPMISMFSAAAPFPVYYILDWLSDKWDAAAYGRNYDFSRTFFEQFAELNCEVPRFNLFVDPNFDENSEYTNCSDYSKNCYLISQASENEDCYYSRSINYCRTCSDCLRIDRSELCFESINLNNCYHCLYCQDCENCTDCSFSSSLRGCKYCFGCHNLAQKEYYYFNAPLSPADWKAKVDAIQLAHEAVEHFLAQSELIRLKTPHRFSRILNCENSSGDHISNCRNSRAVFDSHGLEFCAYCNEVTNGATYSQDFSMWGSDAELIYECVACGHSAYHLLFSNQCWQGVSELAYCDSCFPSVTHCFGCVGLQRKSHCILNKQYSKNEYEKMLPKIIGHMQETGEWGEFFPIELSPFGYNETMAYEYFPVAKEEALANGWKWHEQNSLAVDPVNNTLLRTPVKEVGDEICDLVFACERSGRPFKIIRQELAFYRKLNLPLPRFHPDERHRARVGMRNPRMLYARTCSSCSRSIMSSYPEERPEQIYCEECYLKHVY